MSNFAIKSKVRLLFLLCCILISGRVFSASTAKLAINGLVTSATCEIMINNVSDASITLAPILTSDLPLKGSTAGSGLFTVTFKGCTDVGNLVYFKFQRPAGASDNTTIPATGGNAKNVGFEIHNSSAQIISFINDESERYATSDSGAAYKVNYVATDTGITAGSVRSSLTASITYK